MTGIRFALEPGAGRDAVPVRSAILGATLAVIVVVTTVTFGSSLRPSSPAPPLYGWNWNYELTASEGRRHPRPPDDAPSRRATTRRRLDRRLLRHAADRRSGRPGDRRATRARRWRPRCSPATPSRPPTRSCSGQQTLAAAQEGGRRGERPSPGAARRRGCGWWGRPPCQRSTAESNQHIEMGLGALISCQLSRPSPTCWATDHRTRPDRRDPLRSVRAPTRSRRSGHSQRFAWTTRPVRRRRHRARPCNDRPRSSTTGRWGPPRRFSVPALAAGQSRPSPSPWWPRCGGDDATSPCSRPSDSPAGSSPHGGMAGERRRVIGTVIGVPLGIIARPHLWDCCSPTRSTLIPTTHRPGQTVTAHRLRFVGAGQHRGRRAGAHRGPNAHSPPLAIRVTAIGDPPDRDRRPRRDPRISPRRPNPRRVRRAPYPGSPRPGAHPAVRPCSRPRRRRSSYG